MAKEEGEQPAQEDAVPPAGVDGAGQDDLVRSDRGGPSAPEVNGIVPPTLAELLEGGHTPKLTRSAQNRLNRTTKGGRSTHPLYNVARKIYNHHEVCDEWMGDDGMVRMMHAIQADRPRPTSRHLLVPLIMDWPLSIWNYDWWERPSKVWEDDRVAVREDRYGECLCWLGVQPGCGCVLEAAERSDSAADQEWDTRWERE